MDAYGVSIGMSKLFFFLQTMPDILKYIPFKVGPDVSVSLLFVKVIVIFKFFHAEKYD